MLPFTRIVIHAMAMSRESRLSSICLINSLSFGDVGLASWSLLVKYRIFMHIETHNAQQCRYACGTILVFLNRGVHLLCWLEVIGLIAVVGMAVWGDTWRRWCVCGNSSFPSLLQEHWRNGSTILRSNDTPER